MSNLVGKKVRILSTMYSKELDDALVGTIREVKRYHGNTQIIEVTCPEVADSYGMGKGFTWAIVPTQYELLEE